jgi:hypothetical protein
VTEYCPACTHAFEKAGAITHTIRADGSIICSICTDHRPCRSTLVAGLAGHAFARKRQDGKTRYRGLEYDGPFR